MIIIYLTQYFYIIIRGNAIITNFSYIIFDMKPSKLSLLENQADQEPDITDIAQIFQKLNNNRSNIAKPYSEYDPQSIFPPPSLISMNNNDNQSQIQKSNCFVSPFKRSGIVQTKQEKQITFGSKYQSNGKKIKRIEIGKVNNSFNHNLPHLKYDEVSEKDCFLDKQLQLQLHPPTINFNITEFFSTKHHLPKPKNHQNQQIRSKTQKILILQENIPNIPPKSQIEENRTNTLATSLIQKNTKKQKIIEQLKAELISLRSKKQQTRQRLTRAKQQQKQTLRTKLSQTNQRKLQFQRYKAQTRMFLNQCNYASQIMPQIQAKLKHLQEFKKKGAAKKGHNRKQTHTDEESIGNNQNQPNYNQNTHNMPDKRNYINQWLAKVEKFKQKVQTDKKYYDKLYHLNLKVEQVTEQILKSFQVNHILKDYVLFYICCPFLSCSASSQQLVEISAFNTQILRPETLTLLKYPKFSSCASKSAIQKQISILFKMSKKIHNSASFYFLQTTIASQIGQNNNLIVFGRQKNQEFQNLMESIHKYQSFSQVMVRFIARVCLIALQEIKVKVDIPSFILPFNIYFTQKCDIKFSNILFNNLFLHQQFRSYLKELKFYYFIAPEALSQKDYSNLSIWSLGILLYYIIYEKYPFEYDFESSFLKETFFIYNDLNFPSKPIINQKTKDFISTCLLGKEKDLSQLLKHQFFQK